MPIFQQWTDEEARKIAIWRIEEPESFFNNEIPIPEHFRHPKRRLEFLASRFLLKHIDADFPFDKMVTDEHGKPLISDGRLYFSLSHSYPFVAVAVSAKQSVGIDIQVWHPRMNVLKHKFLSAKEIDLFGEEDAALTAAWCGKEAAYKWHGKRGVEIASHFRIVHFSSTNSNMIIEININNVWTKKIVNYKIYNEFCLSLA